MKLYLMPDACSLAVHIVLRELGIDCELVRVDSGRKRTSDGRSYLDINLEGYVPALELDDRRVLTEVTAILFYLAQMHPAGGTALLPDRSDLGDYELHRWLNFISSELQARFDLFFLRGMPAEAQEIARGKILARLGCVARHLHDSDVLIGDRYGIADAYLFTILRWAPWFDIELGRWPAIERFMAKIGDRDAVQEALDAEARLSPVQV